MSQDFHDGRQGVRLPYRNQIPSRRIVCQELQMSCGAACVRQLLSDEGIEVAESVIRAEAEFSSEWGTEVGNLAKALTQLHPNTLYRGGGVVPGAFESLNRTGSWIARVKPITGPHFIIVDGVKDELVQIRDPWGPLAPGIGQGWVAKLALSDFFDYWRLGINQAVFRTK
ncbi:MAG: hypothetical protein F6J92_22825 [Symploca sp. SIO1A3]|nr:hypothetical protein [Symploca sp. SIO1A3]